MQAFAVDARRLQTLRQSMGSECTTLHELTGPEGRLAAMIAEFNNKRAWRVEGFPTVYVIDHEGVIHDKNVRCPELQRAVEELLSRVPAAQP